MQISLALVGVGTGGASVLVAVGVAYLLAILVSVGAGSARVAWTGRLGEELTYRVKVFNNYTSDLTINLSVEDTAGWGPTLDNGSLSIPQGENKTTLLRVTVPSGGFCAEDNITVTATASGHPDVTESYTVTAHSAFRLPATEDAYVGDDDPESNHGDMNYLYVGRYQDYWQYAYLKFGNLDEIPSGVNITEAKLCLWAWKAYGSAQLMEVRESDDFWTEMTINWNNKENMNGRLLRGIIQVQRHSVRYGHL